MISGPETGMKPTAGTWQNPIPVRNLTQLSVLPYEVNVFDNANLAHSAAARLAVRACARVGIRRRRVQVHGSERTDRLHEPDRHVQALPTGIDVFRPAGIGRLDSAKSDRAH